MNWYKGKQTKHVKEMEMGRKRSKLGEYSIVCSSFTDLIFIFPPFHQTVLTQPQRVIFDKVKAFVLDNRKVSPSQYRSALLSMPNTFPARERKFISTLAEDLHLLVTWDEYDDYDQNLVTWRLPGALEEALPGPEGQKTNGDAEGEGEWEDVDDDEDEDDEDGDDDEESNAAVDRVLKKYGKAQVMDDDEGGGFDARYDRSVKEKMDEWKRGYYRVRSARLSCYWLC
jgi:5'-3' exoribonuclease 1